MHRVELALTSFLRSVRVIVVNNKNWNFIDMKQSLRIAVAVFSISSILLMTNLGFTKDINPIRHSAIELIENKMDDFHDAADKGDSARYLNHFAKDGVFMGTDDWERWPFDGFSKYVNKHFKDGKGWSYKPIKRFTNINSEEAFAWVDEIVESEKWGRFRGTAVLTKTEQGWKIQHYSLTVLVPNESWEAVSEISKKAFSERAVEAGVEPVSVE
jgi:ketosteroid isomerase-like protein